MVRELLETPEWGMQYFTPELFRRFNSEDEVEADAAQDEWEAATEVYQHSLEKLLHREPHLTPLARLNLHDAVITDIDHYPNWEEERVHWEQGRSFTPDGLVLWPHPVYPHSPRPFPFTLTVSLKGRAAGLIYFLWDAVRWHRGGREAHPPRRRPPIWLYDEIGVIWGPLGMFVHRVLLSDMTVMVVPFFSAKVIEVPSPMMTEFSPETE